MATGGKWDALENRSNSPIGNRWQPTATVSERMVRRGSTVRVRRRALHARCARAPATMSILSNLNREALPSKATRLLAANDVVMIRTPGGGGWGEIAAPQGDSAK